MRPWGVRTDERALRNPLAMPSVDGPFEHAVHICGPTIGVDFPSEKLLEHFTARRIPLDGVTSPEGCIYSCYHFFWPALLTEECLQGIDVTLSLLDAWRAPNLDLEAVPGTCDFTGWEKKAWKPAPTAKRS